MQRIDYFAGIPLCGLLSCWEKAKNFLFSVSKRDIFALPTKKLLFIELSEMGSAFLAYPVLKQSVEKLGKENVFFLIFTKNRESVDILDVIPKENVITISDRSFIDFAVGTLKALFFIWKNNIDTTIDMELFSRATAIISYLSGAKKRVGFDNFTDEGLYRGSFITHRVFLNNHHHISHNFLALFEALSSSYDELPQLKKNVSSLMCELPHIKPSDEELEKIWSRISLLNSKITKNDKIFILNPDPGLLALRGWPTDRYKEVAKYILKTYPNVFVLLLGLSRSSTYADLVLPEEYKDRCINFCGQTDNLKDVTTLFAISDLLLTNDSGPGHLATLSRIPAVVLFGPESPLKYGPLGQQVESLFANLSCSPCYSAANHRYSICSNNRCLQAIETNQVIQICSNKISN